MEIFSFDIFLAEILEKVVVSVLFFLTSVIVVNFGKFCYGNGGSGTSASAETSISASQIFLRAEPPLWRIRFCGNF